MGNFCVGSWIIHLFQIMVWCVIFNFGIIYNNEQKFIFFAKYTGMSLFITWHQYICDDPEAKFTARGAHVILRMCVAREKKWAVLEP